MKTKTQKHDVRKTTAEAFIAAIKEKPLTWHCGFRKLATPVNGVRNTKYGRYNRFYLLLTMMSRGYKDNRWYPQNYIFGSKENRDKEWDDPTKIKVMKGESPVYIDTSFYVPTKEGYEAGFEVISPPQYFRLSEDNKLNYRKYPARKPVAVYNGEQLTGIEPYKRPDDLILTREDIKKKVERTIKNMDVSINEQFYVETPSYNPFGDSINMPPFETYENEYEYFATLLHEMAHSTAHKTRLNRPMNLDHSSPEYAIEELRAEIASCFSAQEFGFELSEKSMENHKAYIQSWIELVEKDESHLIDAINDAEKIADYIEDKSLVLNKDREMVLVHKMQRRFFDIVEYYPQYSICLETDDFDILTSSLIDYASKYNEENYTLEFVDNLGFTYEELDIVLENEGIILSEKDKSDSVIANDIAFDPGKKNENHIQKIAVEAGYCFNVFDKDKVSHIALIGTGVYVNYNDTEYELHAATTYDESRKVDRMLDMYGEMRIKDYKVNKSNISFNK